ncbi:hypothetical protein HYE82_00930 [Streptomyces sp. BR123]|uniref:hypothetical protein n=1 Tax=Streptomyces sp. BR123 TaxID=2749828 RepID=UPI0015C48550|nr:hypothetical protein [Streptomyces sp. BR123]NXY93008.1 hypothetical protein [Streptomyces sp. BR123]
MKGPVPDGPERTGRRHVPDHLVKGDVPDVTPGRNPGNEAALFAGILPIPTSTS